MLDHASDRPSHFLRIADRWGDLLHLVPPAMRDLLPDLNCSKQVPALMERVVETGAQGVANAKGFYNYTPAQAKRWEKRFLKFSYDIRALARKYPEENSSPISETLARFNKQRNGQKQP